MTRGKYGAKAANRLAAFDNELLQEKTAEVAHLQQQLAALRAELAGERADRGALVIARASALAADEIRSAINDKHAAQENHRTQLRSIAEMLADYFHKQGWYPPFWGDKLMPLLIPDDLERSRFFDEHLFDAESTRYTRRQGARNITRNAAIRKHTDRAIDRVLALEKEAEGQFERVGFGFRRIDKPDDEQET